MEHKLIKRTSQGLETISVWVEGNAVRTLSVRLWELGSKSGKTSHRTPERAQAALEARVAELVASGFAYRHGPGKTASAARAPKPSKARPVTAPSWSNHRALASHQKRLRALVKKAGLSHRLDELVALARPTIAFSLARVGTVPLHVSRLGGAPEVKPPGSLHFVAQVALEELKGMDLEGVLPTKGLLSFFAQLNERRHDYATVGHVVHTLGPTAFQPVALGTGQVGRLKPRLTLTLPAAEDPCVEALGLTDEEREAWHDDVHLEFTPAEPAHLLLGYGSAGTEHSLEGRPFLAQFAADERVGFGEGDDQTLRFFFKGQRRFGAVLCTLEEA